jgi:hypothetical protein
VNDLLILLPLFATLGIGPENVEGDFDFQAKLEEFEDDDDDNADEAGDDPGAAYGASILIFDGECSLPSLQDHTLIIFLQIFFTRQTRMTSSIQSHVMHSTSSPVWTIDYVDHKNATSTLTLLVLSPLTTPAAEVAVVEEDVDEVEEDAGVVAAEGEDEGEAVPTVVKEAGTIREMTEAVAAVHLKQLPQLRRRCVLPQCIR